MAKPTSSRSPEETTILQRARQRLPGGVLGTSRYADDVGFVVKRGLGSKIYDVSGREYIDYVMASGPMVLGHAHPAVVAAVREQLAAGTTYFMVTEPITLPLKWAQSASGLQLCISRGVETIGITSRPRLAGPDISRYAGASGARTSWPRLRPAISRIRSVLDRALAPRP